MKPTTNAASRRNFLKTSTAAMVGAPMVAGALDLSRSAHAASNDTLKVGVIGCGGRGTGAAVNALRADENTKITAMADLFADRLESSLNGLKRRYADRVTVTDDTSFVGFDAYKKLMATDVDVVILATPPHFRPAQLREAVDQGKHIFCEKPVAVDAPGVRSCFESTKLAKEKGLNLVSGLCWRYDLGVRETVKRIQDGAIGDVVAIQENYLAGTLWHRGRKPEWSDMEWQCRNWLYFTWLSGDHNTEQHVHSLDKALWLNDDQPPVSCVGLGGRLVRTDEKFGDIYDHHAVCYQFPKMKVFAYTRQMRGCKSDVNDYVLGSKGTAKILSFSIEPNEGSPWKYAGSKPSMYDQEHIDLFGAIRSGNTINNGDYMTKSTMLAIMGRISEYTGQEISWDKAMNSQEDLSPEKYEWGPAPEVRVKLPGVTKFV